MVTKLQINNLSDIRGEFISDMLKAMFSSYGEIEVIIKPKTEIVKEEIYRRVEDVENGAELIYFNAGEFEELNKKLLIGKKLKKSELNKTKKHETNNIISK